MSLVLICSLASCALDPQSQSMMDAYRLIEQGQVVSDADLNPNYRYLRVQVEGHPIFMALGYVDQVPSGPVEVWYSADHNLIRLQNGRLVGAVVKSGVSWLSVSFDHLPRWDAISNQAVFERSRDVSPGYRYGIRETMLIRRIASPADTNLQRVPAASLSWFEESVEGGKDSRPSRYALNHEGRVIYGEQCLSREFCLSWQDWPYTGKGLH